MRRIAAVLFDDFEMLDLYGPLELFSFFRDEFQIVTVADTARPVRASGGPETVAAAPYDAAKGFEILLVPGGSGTRNVVDDAGFLDWLRAASNEAEIVSSVCTGSLLLGKAGLLDGRKATTNKLAFDWVKDQVPGADWQRKARWVVNGKFWTSSGVSAGTDMAVALIKHLLGEEAAKNACLWAEYVNNPDPENDPFA